MLSTTIKLSSDSTLSKRKKKLYYKQTLSTGWQCIKRKSLHSRQPKKIHTNPQETFRSVCIFQRRQSKKPLHSKEHVSD